MPDRQRGVVAKWLNHKGIGFITPEGQEESENDILVHFSQIKQESEDGFKSLQHGSTVEYDLEKDPKNEDKMVAMNVTGPEGADCEARVKGEKKGEKKGGKKGKGKGGKKGKGKGKKGKGKSKDAEDDEEEEE